MGYYKNDLDHYINKFGEEEFLLTSKCTFVLDNVIRQGSLFVTDKHLTFVRAKVNFAYKIPFAHITFYEEDLKILKYKLHINYGEGYSAILEFTDKNEMNSVIIVLKMGHIVEKKKYEIERDKETLSLELNKINILRENTEVELEDYREKKVKYIEEELLVLKSKVNKKEVELIELNNIISERQSHLNKLLKQIDDTEIENDFKEIFVRHFEEHITSTGINDKLSMLNLKEKEYIKNGKAIVHYGFEDRKIIINAQVKQILRSFDTECNYFFSNLTFRNYENYHNKVIKAYETLNRIYKVDDVEITKKYLQIKLEKLNLIYEKERKIAQEREIQKEIKEQMKEEERVRRELENERKKLEKEECQFSNEVNNLFKRLEKTNNDIEKELYAEKIKQLEEKLQALEEDKKDVINRETNTRAGYVYVISNIGSFGEDVYKIGMTRRLEPYDRVKELGDASVPFGFDVHAMIFSDDAPKLENILHRHFRDCEINKVNHRKEFFRVNIDEIEQLVKTEHNNTVKFTKVAQAEQYWESQNISKNEGLIEELS